MLQRTRDLNSPAGPLRSRNRGRGIRRRIRILSGATVVEYNGTRLSTSARGGEGAEAGGQGRCWVERAGGEVVDRSGEIEFAVETGDVVGVDTPGGGGFG